METDTITLQKNVRKNSKIDMELLGQLLSSFKDIKEGKVKRVK